MPPFNWISSYLFDLIWVTWTIRGKRQNLWLFTGLFLVLLKGCLLCSWNLVLENGLFGLVHGRFMASWNIKKIIFKMYLGFSKICQEIEIPVTFWGKTKTEKKNDVGLGGCSIFLVAQKDYVIKDLLYFRDFNFLHIFCKPCIKHVRKILPNIISIAP